MCVYNHHTCPTHQKVIIIFKPILIRQAMPSHNVQVDVGLGRTVRCLLNMNTIGICSRSDHLWSSGQSSWIQIQRSQVRFLALPDYSASSWSGMGSTQPQEYNWVATWKKKYRFRSRKSRIRPPTSTVHRSTLNHGDLETWLNTKRYVTLFHHFRNRITEALLY
jgi:hypothetical protein